MPRRDGTGPIGMGAGYGRGLGMCENYTNNNGFAGYGRGYYGRGNGFALGRAYGFGHGFRSNMPISDTDYKKQLEDETVFLEKRIETLRAEIGNIENKSK